MATDCQGNLREYRGKIDGPLPDDDTLIECDECGEIQMRRKGIILRPGRPARPAQPEPPA